ncbi:MAG: DnaA regulatory inactivator Hda [Rhodanobacter sp.]
MTSQLPLALRWPRRQRFEHFHAGSNAAAVSAVRALALQTDAPWVYLHGPSGSGRSHLLMASCQACMAGNADTELSEPARGAVGAARRAQYLPLAALDDPLAALLGAVGNGLLALDDLDAVAGNDPAERALFDLYNRARADGCALLFAASTAPAQLGITLPDLRSRLGACARFALKPLDVAARRSVLHDYAAERGMHLDKPVLDWLFARYPRDLGALLDLLDQLDRASLAAQRSLTVPFVREFLRSTAHSG